MTLVVIGLILGVASCFPPSGPVAVLVLRRGLFGDLRGAFCVGVGRTIPEALYCTGAIFGVDLLISAFPLARQILQWAGIGILFGLGLYFVAGDATPKLSDDEGGQNTEHPFKDFSLGFTLSLLNPTLAVTWPTIIGITVSWTGLTFETWQKFAFPAALAAGIVLGYALLVWLLRQYGATLKTRLISHLVRLMGLGLLGLAGWQILKMVLEN